MFSPWYHWAGRKDPENHVCLNVSIYGPKARFTMTERGRRASERTETRFRLGPSELRWEAGGLTVEIDERANPLPRRVRGRVRLTPGGINPRAFALDARGAHIWRPVSPASRVEAEFTSPDLRFSGPAYLDSNWGTRPIEADFRRWDWSRAPLGEGAAILYDTERRDGSRQSLALRFDRDGTPTETAAPERADLPTTLWGVKRYSQTEDGAPAREVKRLQDSPFYARAEIETRLFGERLRAMHETFDGDRMAAAWVRGLLPWRIPRLR